MSRIKLLSVLLSAVIIGAVFATAVPLAISQGQPGGSITLPGLGLQGFSGDSNQISLSMSIASQDGSKIYFLVNKIAIAGSNAQAATVYELNGALPGVVDTNDNSFQIDMSQLSSYLQGPRQVSVNDLYSIMRPDPKVLMVRFSTGGASMQGSQAVFQVNSIDMIPPDGNAQTFTMSQPVSLVYDQSTQRMYTVGFSQMYELLQYLHNEHPEQHVHDGRHQYHHNQRDHSHAADLLPGGVADRHPGAVPDLLPGAVPGAVPDGEAIGHAQADGIDYPEADRVRDSDAQADGSSRQAGDCHPKPTGSVTPKPTGSVTPKPTVTVTPKPTVTLKPTTKPSLMPTGHTDRHIEADAGSDAETDVQAYD